LWTTQPKAFNLNTKEGNKSVPLAVPGASAQIGQQFSIVEEVSAQDLRNAEYEMPVGNLFENIHAQPLPEFHHALLMAGGAEVTALAGKGEEIFMAAVLAF
jgi:hypothetical protein